VKIICNEVVFTVPSMQKLTPFSGVVRYTLVVAQLIKKLRNSPHITEMSTRKLSGVEGRPVRKPDLTAISEPIF
jgi:hypothetical protein